MKWLGAMLIFLAAAGIGKYYHFRLIRHIDQLDAALEAVRTIRQRIEYFLEPLDAILIQLKKENPLFFRNDERDFRVGWDRAITGRADLLKRDEAEALHRFGEALGKSDREGQTLLCDIMAEQLQDFRLAAREEKARFSRLAVLLPVFAGAALVILFV